MKTALGRIAFITRCSLPLWVRWHSSTKTKSSPTAWQGCASSSLMNWSKLSTSFFPNLWTSEQSRRGLACPSCFIRSRPLLARSMASPISRKKSWICLSSSSRSVMTTTRAWGLCSRIHFARSTMTMLLPLPWVCQMMPPLRSRTCFCAALIPKYWCTRGNFFTPPSKSMKSCISSISRSFAHILSRYLSSLKRVLSASSSFHFRKYFSSVPIAPYCRPSESLPAKINCTVLKKGALNSGCWFETLWRMPSPIEVRLFFSWHHAYGDAVHIQHEVWAAFVVAVQSDLFGNGEVVLVRFRPVDQFEGFGVLARRDFHWHAIAQQFIDFLIVPVEPAAVVVGLRAEIVNGLADLRRIVAGLDQVGRQQFFFDVAVAVAVGPIAEVAVAEFVTEEGDDAVLGGAFGLANIHTSRIFPVKRLCIMPCLSWRVFSSLASRAAISASMQERTAAIVSCSRLVGGNGITLSRISLRDKPGINPVAAAPNRDASRSREK